VRAIGSRAIASAVVLRLARLPSDAAAVARAVAVLGDGADLRRVAALAGVGEERTGGAAAVLSRAEILRPETPLAFVHPLVRDAVYRDIPPGERELAHERAARVLHEAGAPTDQVAGHLLSVPPRGEEWIADVLHEAGSAAMRRGAAESAVAHLRRALEEPPPAGQRPGLLLELGSAEALSSAPEAVRHLREAYDTLEDPALRIATAHVLGRGLAFAGEVGASVAATERAIADLPPGFDDARKQLDAFRLVVKWFGVDDDLHELRSETVTRYRTLEPFADVGDRLMALLAALDSLYLDDPADVAADIALRALEGGAVIAFDNGLFSSGAINCLSMADREEAIAACDACLEDAHRRGSLFSVSSVHLWRGHAHLLRGDLVDAEADLTTAVSEFELYGYGANAMTYVGAFLALVRLERGDVDGAWEALSRGAEAGSEISDAVRFHRNARLALLLADGRDTEALAAADALRVRQDGWVNPLMHRWRSGRAIALSRLGRADEALPLLEEELVLARSKGAPGTLGPTLRIIGELTGKIGALEEAVAVLDGSTARLELAKALLALGARRGDAGMLRRAHAIATGAGAQPVLVGARDALAALGEQPGPAGADGLTGTERRVAKLAAEGRPNRDIAQALFLTPRDVERHLSAAAAKLGSDSRRALAAALAG
jgi:DNA-binding CsgD family transcriptional regulator/tetratricopeptide (TPR) repeat protein